MNCLTKFVLNKEWKITYDCQMIYFPWNIHPAYKYREKRRKLLNFTFYQGLDTVLVIMPRFLKSFKKLIEI